ncbi:MAG: ribosomal protein L7/L12 [Clostridium sp.]
MALIKCPECGKEISDKALACIHCGFPLKEINKEENKKCEFYKVILIESGSNKIKVIKELRQMFDLGLKEAKDIVDFAPTVLSESLTLNDAQCTKKQLESLGAIINIEENPNATGVTKVNISKIKSTVNQYSGPRCPK